MDDPWDAGFMFLLGFIAGLASGIVIATLAVLLL